MSREEAFQRMADISNALRRMDMDLGVKEENDRIIKLLKEHAVSVDEGGGCWCNCGKGFMRDWDYNEHLLTVIKGENK